MKTVFSYDVRVIACENCGGPVDAAPSGGTFQCSFCRAVNEIVPRSEEQILAHQPTPISEPERVARLRSQDGRPLVPPASLQGLLAGGQLPEWKIQEAVHVWNATKKELDGGANYEAAERLVFLTMVLANHFSDQNDLRRQRAMFESALDAVSLPRHKQILRGYLARSAARERDFAAAERWLAPCDARSDDLQSDSALRFSRAFLETARGNYGGVLQWVGRDADEIPLMDAVDAVCAVLRANAWERLGHVQTAVQQLSAYMSAGGALGRQTVQKVIATYPAWQLCSQSYAVASRTHDAQAGRVAAKRASGGIHKVFIPLGIGFALLGLGSLGLVAIGGAMATLDLGTGIRELDEILLGVGGLTGVILAVTFLPMGLLFFAIGSAMRKAAARAERLRVHGVHATGTIKSLQPTGMAINDVPQIAITITVQMSGRSPYEATTKMLLPGRGTELPIGSTVALRIDPQNPADILIETD